MKNIPKNILLLIFLFIISCKKPFKDVEKGIINLEKIEHPVKLSGEWKFFYNSYIKNEVEYKKQNKFQFKQIPGTWRNKLAFKNDFPSKGYGTYVCEINLKSLPNDKIGLLINDISFAGEVWVNGILLHKRGNFSFTESSNKINIEKALLTLNPSKKYLICIPVSNYQNAIGGGLLEEPFIGKRILLRHIMHFETTKGMVSLLILFLISIITIFIYFFDTKRIILIYFGLFFLTFTLRQLFTDAGLISFIYGELDETLIQKFRAICFFICVGFGSKYFEILFSSIVKISKNNIILYSAFFFSFLTLILNSFYCSYLIFPFKLILLYYILKVFLNIILIAKNDKNYSKMHFFAISCLLLIVINDIFISQNFIHVEIHQHLGFIIFTISQIYLIIKFIKKQEDDIKALNQIILVRDEELEYKKRDLDYFTLDSEHKLKSKKEILDEISSKLDSNSINNEEIKKTVQKLRKELMLEESVSLSSKDKELISSKFKDELFTKFPDLSKTEIEICMMVRLNLGINEIALKRKTSQDSIKTALYRIRKKTNTNTTIELQSLLEKIN